MATSDRPRGHGPLLLTTLVATLAFTLTGQLALPLEEQLAWAVLGPAALTPLLLRYARLPASLQMVCWTVPLSILGWLLGLQWELGTFGLVILDSWCANPAGTLMRVLLAKAQLVPGAAVGMLIGAMGAMVMVVAGNSQPLRGHRWLWMMLLMPAGMIVADACAFALASVLSVSTTVVMLVGMAVVMTLISVLVGHVRGSAAPVSPAPSARLCR